MAAEAARVLEYPDDYVYGSALPAREFPARAFPSGERNARPEPVPAEVPYGQELPRQRERAAAAADAQSRAGVSLFAVLGSVFVSVLMIFAILAQIKYNEVANEAARLNDQLLLLEEAERRLEITFESVVDMKEVERYARDVLGMSKPEAEQITVIRGAQQDVAVIVDDGAGGQSALRGLSAFLSSLAEYFKR